MISNESHSIKYYLNYLIPHGEGGVTGNSEQADSSELLELSGSCGELFGQPAGLPGRAEVGFEQEEQHSKSMEFHLLCFEPLKELEIK